MKSYDIPSITEIPVSAIVGELDVRCPADKNIAIMSSITGFASSSVLSATHTDLVSNNNAEFVNLLLSSLPEFTEPLSDV